MSDLNKEFRKTQTNKLIGDLKGFPMKIKLRNGFDGKETFWLNISEEEFLKIKSILEYEEVLI